MGEIVGAGLLAHVPTIVLPDELRRELNNGHESTLSRGTAPSCDARSSTVVKPDLVLVFDSHWFTTVEFVVSAARAPQGLLHHRRTATRHVERCPTTCPATPTSPGSSARSPTRPRTAGSPRSTTNTCPIDYATTELPPVLAGRRGVDRR